MIHARASLDGASCREVPLVEISIRREVEIPVRAHRATFVTFHGLGDGTEHVAIAFGDARAQAAPLVRLHSECLTGDVFGSCRCDCGDQLNEAIERMQQRGGILVYLRQEGRGIGLYNKLDAYALQAEGADTYLANEQLGFAPDLRDYSAAAAMLRALGKTTIRLLSNNPDKAGQLERCGIAIEEIVPTSVFLKEDNRAYLEAKAGRGNHAITLK